MEGRTNDRPGVAARLAGLAGLVAALPAIGYGLFLLLVGPTTTVESASGVSLSIGIPTPLGFVAVVAGAFALAGVTLRRPGLVGAGGLVALVIGITSLSTLGLPMLPVAGVLAVAAAGEVADPATRRAALSASLAGVGLAAAFALALTVPIHHEETFRYSVADPTTLNVVVITGDPVPCAVERVEESGAEVRVHAECVYPLLTTGSLAMEIDHPFVVHLRAPLGSRQVLNGAGVPATLE